MRGADLPLLLRPIATLSNLEVDVASLAEVTFTSSGRHRDHRTLADLVTTPDTLPNNCAICLVTFEEGERLRITPCGGSHVFHSRCIERWLSRNPSCPLLPRELQTKAN